MNKIADRFYTGPASGSGAEDSPGNIYSSLSTSQYQLDNAKKKRYDGDLSNVVLRHFRCVGVQFARITNDCIIEKTNHSPSGN